MPDLPSGIVIANFGANQLVVPRLGDIIKFPPDWTRYSIGVDFLDTELTHVVVETHELPTGRRWRLGCQWPTSRYYATGIAQECYVPCEVVTCLQCLSEAS